MSRHMVPMCLYFAEIVRTKGRTQTIEKRQIIIAAITPKSSPPNAAPCPPDNVDKSVHCDNHTASISWSSVPGAVSYTATLEQMDGSTTCCTTSNNSCDISNLPCGEMYTVLVVAEGRTCNSSQRDAGLLRSGRSDTCYLCITLKEKV